MSYAETSRLIRQRLNVVMTSAGVDIVYGNAPAKEQDIDELWAIATIQYGQAIQVETPGTVRIPGDLVVQLFSPLNVGTQNIETAGDFVVDNFMRYQEECSLHFFVPYKEVVGPRNGWWQENVTCPFKVDRILRSD